MPAGSRKVRVGGSQQIENDDAKYSAKDDPGEPAGPPLGLGACLRAAHGRGIEALLRASALDKRALEDFKNLDG